jgi:transcription antitermination factor NusG
MCAESLESATSRAALELENLKMPFFVVTARQQINFKLKPEAERIADRIAEAKGIKAKGNGYECTVIKNLEDAEYEPYLPCYRKTFYKGRHRQWEPASLFGRYIFVKFDDRWPDVHKVRGICNVLKACATDELPSIIKDDVIAEWKKKEKDGFVVGFQKDQPVRARNGIFADQVGRFVGLSNRHHDVALFDILGQSVRIEFQQQQCRTSAGDGARSARRRSGCRSTFDISGLRL